MKQGIHDVLDRYPDQWNINNFAVFSCLTGDKKTTRTLMGMIKGRPILGPWEKGSFFVSIRLSHSGFNFSATP
ncbi:MAG: hypothetical protein GY737_10380 [Desulfobacteraceae bacterium]|nr:hypothetical protein [Desulfobacteraceae bacterium]